MKARKILLSALLCIVVFTSAAFSVEVEDALTPCAEQSVYVVLKLNDTQNLLKWIFSKENIDTFMPLILASKESNEIIGAIEMISAFAENTPLQSVAFTVGAEVNKTPAPFFKAAFTVKPGYEAIYKKVADGSAEAIDIAKLLIGKDNPLASFAESMVKVEKTEDNILRVDNELFMKAQDNMILVGMSADDIKASLNALENEDARLFSKLQRKFAPKDFAWIHLDPKAVDDLDEEDAIDPKEVAKYVKAPLNIEYGFMRVPNKFLMSVATNLSEAMSEEYLEKLKLARETKPVKGGHINLENSGANAPLLALGNMFNIEGVIVRPEVEEAWKEVVKQVKNRFNISEEDLTGLLTGALSFVINDSVSAEGIKLPAIYISQTGKAGVAEKIFAALEKSQHLSKVQDGVLQVDSSLSPVSCIITKNGDTLGVSMADIANVSAKPQLKPVLQELMDTDSTSSIWLDFAGIQSWIVAPENGVLALAEPLARFSGQGEIFDACKEILEAKFSIPSMAIHSDSFEVSHIEFQIDESVKPEEGLLTRLVKLARKFMPEEKADDKQENPEKTEETK